MPRRKYTLDLNNIINESPAKYYWLGFIAGDGNIAKKEARLRIELKTDDIEHLKKFNEFMGSNSPLVERVNNVGCHCVCLSINSAELKRYLAQYNLIPAKTLSFTIPEDKIPKEYLYDFIRGLHDSDGSLSFRNKNYSKPIFQLTTANLECANQIKSILNIDTKIKNVNGAFVVGKEGKGVKPILEKLYKNSTEDTRLKRKYDLWSLIE